MRRRGRLRARRSTNYLKVKGGVGTLTIQGRGVNTGAEPLGYLSKVSAFELGATSGKATLGPGVSEYARAADLEYIGAATQGQHRVLRALDARELGDAGDGGRVQHPDRP